jgi:hypothetical protein
MIAFAVFRPMGGLGLPMGLPAVSPGMAGTQLARLMAANCRLAYGGALSRPAACQRMGAVRCVGGDPGGRGMGTKVRLEAVRSSHRTTSSPPAPSPGGWSESDTHR